jgi:hypothetical protein
MRALRTHFSLEGELSLTEKSRVLWEDEDEDLTESLTNRPLVGLLEVAKDNRLLLSVGESVRLVLWVIHVVEEVEIKLVAASTLHAGFKMLPSLADIEK